MRRLFLTLSASLALGCDRTPESKGDTAPSRPVAIASVAPVTTATPGGATLPSTSGNAAESPKPAPSSFRLEANKRVIAIGDLHGDLTALRRALQLGGALDSDLHWVGKDLTVVQTGDQVDRGDQDREVIDEIERLEGEAKAAGSTLIVLNGNHELMNVGFDFRYVTPKSFASFADFKGRAPLGAERLPEDERGRAAAFAPGGPYAQKLARHLTVALVGDTLFAHGGVLPAHVDYGLDRINAAAKRYLSGDAGELPPALSGEDAVVWTRVYGGPEVDEATCQGLTRVLSGLGAKRLVVGHTVQKDGISGACSDRLFRIDVGLSSYYGNNPVQVLEITKAGTRILSMASTEKSPSKGSSAESGLHSAP